MELSYLTEFYATQIDFRYNNKTKNHGVVRLNSDPTYVLYKDGRCRKTTEKEIIRQLEELTSLLD